MDRDRGFVLPVVLFVLAGVALILTASLRNFDLVANDLLREQERLRQEFAAETVVARTAYLLATQPRQPGGIAVGAPLLSRTDVLGNQAGIAEEAQESFGALDQPSPPILVDGRPQILRTDNEAFVVSLADANGLLNPNIGTVEETERLLRSVGLAGEDPSRLAAILADYIDVDDDERLGGMERFAYPEGEAPLNGPLPTREALFSLPGWRDLDPAVVSRLRETLWTASKRPRKNVNSATREKLAAVYGLESASIVIALEERQKEPFKSLRDMSSRIGSPVDGDPFVMHTMPGTLYRLRVQRAQGGPVFEVRMELDVTADRPVTIRHLGSWEGRSTDAQRRAISEARAFPTPPRAFAVRGWSDR